VLHGGDGLVTQTTRITIDIDAGSDPISGHIMLPGRATTVFVGWSALAGLLEAARTLHRRPPSQSSSPAPAAADRNTEGDGGWAVSSQSDEE
jgi:hypothetical protein